MNQTPESSFPIEISVTEVKQLLDAGDLVLIDCRPEKMDLLKPHKEKQIVVHCHLGGRSLQVTQYLRGQGFDKVQNMTGGIEAWSIEVDPKVARY